MDGHCNSCTVCAGRSLNSLSPSRRARLPRYRLPCSSFWSSLKKSLSLARCAPQALLCASHIVDVAVLSFSLGCSNDVFAFNFRLWRLFSTIVSFSYFSIGPCESRLVQLVLTPAGSEPQIGPPCISSLLIPLSWSPYKAFSHRLVAQFD